mgnify:CR=1 FL=1
MERLDRRVAALDTTRGGPAETPRLRNAYRYSGYYMRLARKGVTKLSDLAIACVHFARLAASLLRREAGQFGLAEKHKPGPYDPSRFVDPQGWQAAVELG